MTLPADPPKLPKWPFLVGDAVLVGVAWIVAHQSPAPLPPIPLIAVVACVVIGAVLATYPFVIEYTRAQEIALDDRQRALETLSVTVATSSEQVSIAANGLHEITELAQRNLKVAEQLPGKIHERLTAIIGGFQDSRADDREELQRELATLRAAQTDKLADITDSIARSVSDLATLHLTAQRQISASAEAITRASASLAPFDAQMSATLQRAEKVFATVPPPPHDDRRGHAVNLPDETAFLNDPVVPLAARTPAPETTSVEFASPMAATAAEVSPIAVDAVPTPPSLPVDSNPPQTAAELISADPFTAAIMSVLEPDKVIAPPQPEVLAPPEPAPIPTQSIAEIVPVAPRDSASMSPMLLPSDTTKLLRPDRKRAPRKPKATTPPIAPAPVSTAVEPEAAPVPSDNNSGSSTSLVDIEPTPSAPPVDATFPSETPAPSHSPVVDEVVSAAAEMPTPPAEPAWDSTPTAEPAVEPTATTEAEPGDSASSEGESEVAKIAPTAEVSEPTELSLSSDGATRLLVTAYIGIGNRLFIRGDGAGLNWEKGVPLQFVSIGKWRWETHEAAAPIAFKLYKNDSIECAELDVKTLEAGRQHEVVAKF